MTTVRDLKWFESQLDEMFLEVLQMTHKGKNIPQAINESYLHLMADELVLKTIDQAGCKRLVNTWLSNKKSVFQKTQTKWKI